MQARILALQGELDKMQERLTETEAREHDISKAASKQDADLRMLRAEKAAADKEHARLIARIQALEV